jgi:glyoxylase-like metal-dependent hydrolase (beta-lactamase superfamily II)
MTMLVKQLTVGMMGVCCYIVSCEQTKQAAVIDPGGDEDRILDYCTSSGLDVIYIINTHGHPDHDCGNARIKEACMPTMSPTSPTRASKIISPALACRHRHRWM